MTIISNFIKKNYGKNWEEETERKYDIKCNFRHSTVSEHASFDKLKELAIPIVQSDTYYGTNKDDNINTPNLGLGERTLIDPGPGNDTVIAEKSQGIVGGIGNDSIKGIPESKITVQYWGHYFDDSINANFITGIITKPKEWSTEGDRWYNGNKTGITGILK